MEYHTDSLESKLFGLGSESYVTGSHEFYTNYCMETKRAIVCMDAGHFHPTESVAAKISSYLAFGQELMLHVSRPVRWDSDHVVILDDETMAAIHEATREAYAEECEINPNFAKVYNSMMDYKEFSSAYREMLEGTDYNYGWGFDYDAAQ